MRPTVLRAGEHSDYGMLTILLPEDVPGGLQVRRPDAADDSAYAWINVSPPEGAFVVNLGDLLAWWKRCTSAR